MYAPSAVPTSTPPTPLPPPLAGVNHAPNHEAPPSGPLRIRLFTDTLADINGVSRFILDMLALAHAARRDLTATTSTRRSLPTHPGITNLPPLFSRPMPGYANLDLAFPIPGAIRRQLQHDRPDLIHISTPGPVGLAAWRAARRLRIPVVATYHTDFPAYINHLFADDALSLASRWAMRTFYRRCALVLTRSAAYAKVVKDLGIHCSRIHALRPGTNTHTFHPRHRDPSIWSALADRRSPAPGSLKLLYVGRVSVEKNLPLLAAAWHEAAAQLASINRNSAAPAELIIVGDGPYLPAMRAALAGTPARFLGFRRGTELSTLYASSDLFLFPSATDTLGQSVLEAQASALPALVSDTGGPREIIRPDHTGLVLPAHDLRAWVRAIVELATSHPCRAAMSAAARAHAQTLSIERSFEHFWELHEDVARTKGAGPHAAPACAP